MFRSSTAFLTHQLKMLHTPAQLQKMMRHGLPMADEARLQVLRVGYTTPVAFLNQQHQHELEYQQHQHHHGDHHQHHHHPAKVSKQVLSSSLRLPFDKRSLRPGGSISGPMMMMMADGAMYAISLALTGNPMAVTSNLQINFLRKPLEHYELVAEAKMLKSGKRLHVYSCDIFACEPGALDFRGSHLEKEEDQEAAAAAVAAEKQNASSTRKITGSKGDARDGKESSADVVPSSIWKRELVYCACPERVELVAFATGAYSIP